MKIFCLLLSLYVLVLSTAPCCGDDDCKGNAKTAQNHSDDDCTGCSPFFTCGTCVGFIFATFGDFHLSASLPAIEVISFYQPDFVSDYFSKVWQPPNLS